MEGFENFNTKALPEDHIFGDFNNQPIPSTCSDLTNDYDDYGNPIKSALVENKWVEDAVVPNDENNYDDSLTSDIGSPPKKYSGN